MEKANEMKPKLTRNPSSLHLSNSTAKPVLTFVDADIVSGKDEIAREQLLSNLQQSGPPGLAAAPPQLH